MSKPLDGKSIMLGIVYGLGIAMGLLLLGINSDQVAISGMTSAQVSTQAAKTAVVPKKVTGSSVTLVAVDVRGLAGGKLNTTPSNSKDAWPPILSDKQVKAHLAIIDTISRDNWVALKRGSKDFGPSSHGSTSDVVLPYIDEVAANGHKLEAQKRLDDLLKYTNACQKAGVIFPDNIFDGKPWIWGDIKDAQAFINACK